MKDLFGWTINDDKKKAQFDRLANYDKQWCYQFEMRRSLREEDLRFSGLSEEDVSRLRVEDFDFSAVNNDDERTKRMCQMFIERHEWLGTIPQYTTHYFTAKLGYHLAGVILMSVPNAFSKLLGEDTDKLERLISRGACISWSPKNLASSFLMWCIKWMVNNTPYRLFTAYSDPTARELGTIYQACNFYYLGQNAGTTKRYINPYNGKICSDRFFRQRSAYKKYATENGIKWDKNWDKDGKIDWDLIPSDIATTLRNASRDKAASAKVIDYPPKHKYAYVLGIDKRETKELRREFVKRNKVYDYPKERGK